MNKGKRTVSLAQWAALAGLTEDGRSLATACTLIAQGDGPEVVPVRRRHRTDTGVQLRGHHQSLGASAPDLDSLDTRDLKEAKALLDTRVREAEAALGVSASNLDSLHVLERIMAHLTRGEWN
jgi:hypothetical protein